MNNAKDAVISEFSSTLTTLISDAAQGMIYDLVKRGVPRDRIRPQFDRRIDAYIKEQTKRYGERMAAIGQPVSPARLEYMQQRLADDITARTDDMIEAINKILHTDSRQ